jgi:hypothetical protein
MATADIFRACLLDLDIETVRRCWAHAAPGMPQPKNDFEVLVTLHHARTQAASVPQKLRCYSHCWLLDRGLPSGLPDHMKPAAQRMYPREVLAVGVAVKPMTAGSIPLAKAMERAMSDAVAECYADGKTSPAFVKARMEDARMSIMKSY